MTNRSKARTWLLAASLVAVSGTRTVRAAADSDLWTAPRSAEERPRLVIQHPIDGAVFPSNFPSPVLLWKTNAGATQQFAAGFIAGERRWLFTGIQPMWRPPEEDWRQIKQAGRQGTIVVVLAGLGGEGGRQVVSRGSISFTLSELSVEYPLFYREVNLPFSEAVKDPSKIRWRFGGLEQGTLPPVVLENLPVCGNCHSLHRVKNQPEEGLEHTRTAVALDPQNGFAQFDLGTALADQGDLSNGVVHLAEAIRLLPNGYDRQYNAVDMHLILGLTNYRLGDYSRSISALERVLAIAADQPRANYLMALAKASLGETETATPYNERAVQRDPELARLPDFYDLLSGNYLKQGLYAKSLTAAEKAWRLASAAGRGREAGKLHQRAELCRKMMAKERGN